MNRPRCREWLPLSTQQMRLRNLVRISGVNIVCGGDIECSLVYYTLHYTFEGEAIYTSESLLQRHSQLQWAEITSADLIKSNANCVCVKVWASSNKLKETNVELEEEESTIAFSKGILPTQVNPQNTAKRTFGDRLLFTWGVYFSGLVPLNPQADVKCSSNALLFQINGDTFASPERLSVEGLREQSKYIYTRHGRDLTPQQPPPTDADAFAINSPPSSRSASPVPSNWLPDDLIRMARTRYIELNCARHEVKRSYSIQQLLRIQELQRLNVQKRRETKNFAKDIQHLSVRCITADYVEQSSHGEQQQHRRRPIVGITGAHQYHQHMQYHSMGRTLSVLLAEQQEVSPHQLLRVQRMQRECETLISRRRLLLHERNKYVERNQRLHARLQIVANEREELERLLTERKNELGAEQEKLLEWQRELVELREKQQRIVFQVDRRMCSLCMELREIYPIERIHGAASSSSFLLCGVPFANAINSLCSLDKATQVRNIAALEHASPTAISVALGFLAHLVQMIAVILHHPLRNPIIHEGSRSRIVDLVKDKPSAYSSREFPLYSRTGLLPKTVRYAIVLLNQNVAQLYFDITDRRCDFSSTIDNLLTIFAELAEFDRKQCNPTATANETIRRDKLYGGWLYKRLNIVNNVDTDAKNHVFGPNDGVDSGSAGFLLRPLDFNYGYSNSTDDCLSKSNSSDINHMSGHLLATLSPPGSLPSIQTDGKTVMTHQEIYDLFQKIPSTSSNSRSVVVGDRTDVQRICRSVGSCDEDDNDIFANFSGSLHRLQRHSSSDPNLVNSRDNASK